MEAFFVVDGFKIVSSYSSITVLMSDIVLFYSSLIPQFGPVLYIYPVFFFLFYWFIYYLLFTICLVVNFCQHRMMHCMQCNMQNKNKIIRKQKLTPINNYYSLELYDNNKLYRLIIIIIKCH